MTLSDFISAYTDKPVDFDGIYPNQCMDLAHWYIYSVLNITDKTVGAAPSAFQVFTNFDNSSAKVYFERIANTPDNVPQSGDIVVWGQDVSPYGHIAVFVDGDVNSFHSFDANWPLDSLPHLQEHNYNGVLGWLRPNKQIDTSKSNEQVQVELKAQIEATTSCQTQLATALQQAGEHQALAQISEDILTDTKKELDDLKLKRDEDQRTIIALKGQLEAVHGEDKDYAVESYEAQQAKKQTDNILKDVASKLGLTNYDPTHDKEGGQIILQVIAEIVKDYKKLESAFIETTPTDPSVPKVSKSSFSLFGWLGRLFVEPKVLTQS